MLDYNFHIDFESMESAFHSMKNMTFSDTTSRHFELHEQYVRDRHFFTFTCFCGAASFTSLARKNFDLESCLMLNVIFDNAIPKLAKATQPNFVYFFVRSFFLDNTQNLCYAILCFRSFELCVVLGILLRTPMFVHIISAP